MSGLGQVAKESTKSLGPSAHLVNVLPSTVLVATVFALVSSHLYPWASPLRDGRGKVIPPGVEAVAHAVQGVKVTGGVALVFVVLLVAVMLRPFQVAAVQILEGYWKRRGLLWALAIELHVRRLNAGRSRSEVTTLPSENLDFTAVASESRRTRGIKRMNYRAKRIVESYPEYLEDVLPTRLGNLLRRAETSAGERYGLTTVVTYGRLYPHLSDRLDRQMAMQLDLLDTMSAFTLVFSGQALATTPLVARFDGWSLLPAAFVVFALIAYRAACQTARHHAVTLATTYDLHRFDMLKALHLPLPGDAEQEYIENLRLSEFFGNEPLLSESERADWKYVHPSAESSTDGSRAQPRPGVKGDSGSSGE